MCRVVSCQFASFAEACLLLINAPHRQRILARSTPDRFGAHTQSARVLRPLPRACRREHSPGSRGRRHPSRVHACDRLPVAIGSRRLDVLAPEPGWRLPAVSRHASSTAAGGAWAGGCSRECGKRPIRWARARAPGSCSLPLSPPPGAPMPTPLEAGASAPASPRAPQRHHPQQARWATVKLHLLGRRVLDLDGTP